MKKQLLATILLGAVSSLVLVLSVQRAAADPALINADAIRQTFYQGLRFTGRGSIDGTSSGWAIEDNTQPDGTVDQSVVWPLVSPLAPPKKGRSLLLDFILSCTSYEALQHTLGHFRLSYTLDPNPDLNSSFVPMTPDAIVSTDPGITFSLVNQGRRGQS